MGVTPPESPQNFSSKSVIATVPTKCTMADKSTKTDDVLLNGCEPELAPLCPTTTNAATMTTVVVQTDAPARPTPTVTTNSTFARQDSKGGCPVPVQVPSPPLPDLQGHPPRMSYAQVAQHHKDSQGKPVKQSPQPEKAVTEACPAVATAPSKGAAVGPPAASQVQGVRQQATPQQQAGERDSSVRDNRDTGHKVAAVRVNANSRQSSGHERLLRRKPEVRQSQLRDFVTTPRSPK